MNKKSLSGFLPVFKYTFMNQVKSKKFIGVTLAFALIIIAGISIAIILLAKPEKKTNTTIEKIYVYDETGLGVPDYNAYATAYEDKGVEKIEFIKVTDAKAAAKEHEKDKDFLILMQEKTDEEFRLTFIPSEENEVSDDAIHTVGDSIGMYFQMHVYASANMTGEELMQAVMPVTVDTRTMGDEEENVGKEITTVFLCLGIVLIVYFMVLFYGQQICTEVSIEKTTKLVEQLLVNVTPYGLVSGKIMAVIVANIIQFALWVASIFVGIFAGDAIAAGVYDSYESKVSFVLDILKEWFGSMAFSPVAIAIACVVMIMGVVLYLILAGVAGSMVTKPEEAPNMQSVFILPMMIVYFVVLFAMIEYEGNIPAFFNFIPFVAPFTTPAMLLIGNISTLFAIIGLIEILAVCVILLLLAAKIYKGLLFYNGDKLTMKTVFKVAFGKTK